MCNININLYNDLVVRDSIAKCVAKLYCGWHVSVRPRLKNP
nr:MAG TPA: hypothetical protein [Caudoviricetes sp.]